MMDIGLGKVMENTLVNWSEREGRRDGVGEHSHMISTG